MKQTVIVYAVLIALMTIFSSQSNAATQANYWVKAKANSKEQRSQIANVGMTIDHIASDYVAGSATAAEVKKLQAMGVVDVSFELTEAHLDFPQKDEKFHNYSELMSELNKLQAKAPNLVKLETIGQSHENRNLVNIHITNFANGKSSDKPGIVFMGAHHAREHLSVEMPLMLAQHLVNSYLKGDTEIVNLVNNRDIHIIPMVNPDGAEYDLTNNKYHMWRKNRRNNSDGNTGVDLNRNYGFMWGTGGSSKSTGSDVYMGKKPFSEPESQAVKAFVESHKNLTTLISFHTFSELILYPWGHKYDGIENVNDFKVHKTMAETMARWNGYVPQQSSDLYIASGDTTDWSYGEHGLISFTFELDPKSMWRGGFYPGQKTIPVAFRKNIKPALYLIEYSDNPYRVIQPLHKKYGLNSALIK